MDIADIIAGRDIDAEPLADGDMITDVVLLYRVVPAHGGESYLGVGTTTGTGGMDQWALVSAGYHAMLGDWQEGSSRPRAGDG